MGNRAQHASLMSPPGRVLKSYARVVLFGLLWCVCMASTSLAASLPNYITRVWTKDDGLPDSRVTAVIQSHDGYLWLGTRSGLARFDGVRFTIFDGGNTPEMQSPHVTSLFEDSDGTIWIGHETGELTVYQDGKFHAVPFKAAWRGGKIRAIIADPANDVWLLNDFGELVRVKDGLFIPSPQGKMAHLIALAGVPGGGTWIRRDNEVSELKDGQLHPVRFDNSAGSRYIQGIGAGRDGGLWVMTDNRMRKWKNGRWTEDLGPAPWGWVAVHFVIETKDGNLVAGTSDKGLYLVFPGQGSLQLCHTNGFPDNWITSLCEDREDNLWVGTGNGGLAVLRPGNITTLNPPDHWQGRVAATGPGARRRHGRPGPAAHDHEPRRRGPYERLQSERRPSAPLYLVGLAGRARPNLGRHVGRQCF